MKVLNLQATIIVLLAISERDFDTADSILWTNLEVSFNPARGLCINVFDRCSYEIGQYIQNHIIPRWEHYSGRPLFPIPNPDYPKNPTEAGNIYGNYIKGFFKQGDRYCDLRCNLAEFVANELKTIRGGKTNDN